jgi:peptide-methionine (S)-S-oxide reductase
MGEKKATFAAGCFWGVEAHLKEVEGVTWTAVGYTGGEVKNPTYQMVCTDKTGHAEAVQVTYDPDKITYKELVRAFFNLHNPTTPNRQGWDIGSQYRSAIFYHNDEQKAAAAKVKNELNQSNKFHREIVTEIVPASDFYAAEEYHQNYYAKHNFRCA